MAIIDWPEILKPLDDVIPYLEGQGASAGQSITGQNRFVRGLAARWRYSMRVKIWSKEEHLAWRSFAAQVEGQLNLVRVPICDCRYIPTYSAGVISTYAGTVPYSDDMPHSDDAGFAQSGIEGQIATAVDAGATSIVINVPSGVIPVSGQGFSIGDRYYQVKTITLISGSTYTLTFGPRLRADLLGGETISFTEFYCLMRLSSEDVLRVDRELLRHSSVTVDFVEALL